MKDERREQHRDCVPDGTPRFPWHLTKPSICHKLLAAVHHTRLVAEASAELEPRLGEQWLAAHMLLWGWPAALQQRQSQS